MGVCPYLRHINTVSMSRRGREGRRGARRSRGDRTTVNGSLHGQAGVGLNPGRPGLCAPEQTTDYMSPTPHAAATSLWTSLSDGPLHSAAVVCLPAGFHSWAGELMKRRATHAGN